MSSINEMMQNVAQTVRATYDYFVEVVQGILNPSQMSEEDVTINVTQTSGSEQTLVVTKPERRAIEKIKPEVPLKAEQAKAKTEEKSSTASVKPEAEKNSANRENTTMKNSTVTAVVSVAEKSSGPTGNIVSVAAEGPKAIVPVATLALVPPAKDEVATDLVKLTTETTSLKCTRCIEQNVFCNQECPNLTNVNRIE